MAPLKELFSSYERGLSNLTLLIFVPLALALGFIAYEVTPFYYNFFELENQMHSLIKVAEVHTDEELRRKLKTHMKRMDLPIGAEDVEMRRFGNSMKMWVSYEETLFFTWSGEDHELYTFEFDAVAEDDF
jgi:hypothetical protein